jgi:hypothetical protein
MCPNCLTNIAMALGGAGSAIAPSLLLGASLAAAGLRFRTVLTHGIALANTEETAS